MILKGIKIMKSQENILNNTKKYRRTKKGVLTNIYNHCKNRKNIEFTLMELKRIRARKILMIKDNIIIKEFNSQREAVIKTGLSQANISSCLNGRRKYCGGYEWIYKTNIYENPELLKED